MGRWAGCVLLLTVACTRENPWFNVQSDDGASADPAGTTEPDATSAATTGEPMSSGPGMTTEGTLDADGRLDVREIMSIAQDEVGAHAGALIIEVNPTYTGGGSPDTCYLVLRWDAR